MIPDFIATSIDVDTPLNATVPSVNLQHRRAVCSGSDIKFSTAHRAYLEDAVLTLYDSLFFFNLCILQLTLPPEQGKRNSTVYR